MSRRRALNFASLPSPADDDQDDDLDVVVPAPAGERQGVVSALTGADTTALITVDALPAPYDAADNRPTTLDEQERATLAACEEALRGFQKSVIVAGKALEVVNRGRLYRETHATFADYVVEVWGMQRAYAYRMIEAWRPAALVSPIGDINEAQARELGPVLKDYGPEVTLALYSEVKELRGSRRVTAADLAQARTALPSPRVLESPEKVPDVLRMAAAEGRAPRLAPHPPQVPSQSFGEQPAGEDSGGVTRDQVDAGAEAMATLEAAVAQARQLYEAVPAEVLAAAMLYDVGRAERLRHDGAQYLARAGFRFRGSGGEDDVEAALAAVERALETLAQAPADVRSQPRFRELLARLQELAG